MKNIALVSMISGLLGMSASARPLPINLNGFMPARKIRLGRSRVKGKPGAAGDKMARMASEGRLGIWV